MTYSSDLRYTTLTRSTDMLSQQKPPKLQKPQSRWIKGFTPKTRPQGEIFTNTEFRCLLVLFFQINLPEYWEGPRVYEKEIRTPGGVSFRQVRQKWEAIVFQSRKTTKEIHSFIHECHSGPASHLSTYVKVGTRNVHISEQQDRKWILRDQFHAG